jgi:hypothetical protein
MTRLRNVILASLIVFSVATAAVVVTGETQSEEDAVEVTNAVLQDQSAEADGPFEILIEYENVAPDTITTDARVTADGVEIETIPIVADPGQGEETYTLYATVEPGEYTIEVSGEEAGQLTVTGSGGVGSESNWPDEPLFGMFGVIIGYPLLGVGILLYGIGVASEVLRGVKEYFGGGSESGLKIAVSFGIAGGVASGIGGILTGGWWQLSIAFAGVLMAIILGSTFGSYYLLKYLYPKL